MDFDNDGKKDVLSGSYDGQVTIFRGQGAGEFAAGVFLKGPDGKPQVVDSAIAVAPVDWDKDGNLDLVLGSLNGSVYYVHNDGGLAMSAPVKLKAGTDELNAPDGGPCMTDWDNDGVPDLILGSEDGSVTFYRGKKGSVPGFDRGRLIVPEIVPKEVEDDQKRLDVFDATAGKRPSMRPKPAVADWNGDGKPDLLVGDFTMLRGKPPKLTETEAEEHRRNTATIDRLSKQMEAVRAKCRGQALKKLGLKEGQALTDDQAARLSEETVSLLAAEPQFDKWNNELIEVFGADQKYQPPVDYHGFVYVFLRK